MRVHFILLCVCQQAMPVVAGNKSSKWDACRLKATRLEYCLRDNNYRPIDCVPEILDLKQCCQLHEVLLPMSHADANEKALVHRLWLECPRILQLAPVAAEDVPLTTIIIIMRRQLHRLLLGVLCSCNASLAANCRGTTCA